MIRRVGALILIGVTTLGLSPAAFAATGSISGTVSNSSSAAVVDIEVVAYNADDTGVSTCTGSNGDYTVSGLAPGPYTVAFWPTNGSGCGAAQNYVSQFYGGGATFAGAQTVTVSSGGNTAANVSLQTGGVITGTVTDSASTALAGIAVEIFDSDNDETLACTGPDGTYSAIGLAPGPFTVKFDPANGLCGSAPNDVAQYYDDQPTTGTPTTVPVTSGVTSPNINAALQPGGNITGTVTDHTSLAGLAGVEVDLYDTQAVNAGFVAETCTAAGGSYSFGHLPGGTYYVGFETSGLNCSARGYAPQFWNAMTGQGSATGVGVTPGSTTSAIDAAMVPAGEIRGTVTDAVTHAGIEYVGVNLLLNGSFVKQTCTGSDGTYAVEGLQPGTYTVSFQPVAGCGGPGVSGYSDQSYSQPVVVAPGASVSNIDEALVPHSSTVTGTVTNAAGGHPISGILVEAADASDDFGRACTAADGTYSITGLPAGSYTVYFDPLSTDCGAPQQLAPQYYNDQVGPGAADTVALNGSAGVSGIDAALSASGAIAGVVTDAVTGQPVANAPVLIYAPGELAVSGACTAGDGSYTIAGLTPGTYTVTFGGTATGCGTPLGYAVQTTASVQVSAGATSAVDALLLRQTQGEITGTVTAAGSGAALQGLAVTLYDSGGTTVGSAVSDAHGEYKLAGLAAGTYRVGFSDPSGKYAAEFYAGATSLSTATPIAVAGGKLSGSINVVLGLKPVAVAVPVPAAGRLTLLSGHTLGVSAKGGFTIKLGCAGSVSCSGRAALTVKLVTHRGHKTITKLLSIGSAAFKLVAGQTLTLTIKLNRAGRAQLTKHHGRIATQLAITGSASGTAIRLASSVTLKGHLRT